MSGFTRLPPTWQAGVDWNFGCRPGQVPRPTSTESSSPSPSRSFEGTAGVPTGVAVAVLVAVGVFVMVGVFVIVGVSLGVGVLLGVGEVVLLGDGVGVFVGAMPQNVLIAASVPKAVDCCGWRSVAMFAANLSPRVVPKN